MAKRGRKPKLSIARVKTALEQAGGIRTIAASLLNCHRSTLHTYLTRHPTLLVFADEIEETIKDIAEAEVIKAIRAGDMQTARWYLELKGKDRGYVRRIENVGKDGGALQVAPASDWKDLMADLNSDERAMLRVILTRARGEQINLAELADDELELLSSIMERHETKTKLFAEVRKAA
ncbi:MAG: hypothetical protein RIB97_00985 [Nitratireductor sp.]